MLVMPYPKSEWKLKCADPVVAQTLATEFKLSSPLATVLAARGMDSAVAKVFLHPRLEHVVPPENLAGIPKAVSRIRQAIERQEFVLVFGDYDADGICGAAVLAIALRALGGRVGVFLPDRITEGYGLSVAAVQRACVKHAETKLLLTVDCGSTQEEGIRHLRERGIDVVVTDHHTLGENVGEVDALACAHVNPKREGTPEALKPLAGVGVAFKLAHALARGTRHSPPVEGCPEGGVVRKDCHAFDVAALLPIVALGTVADVVPLQGENRILVKAGLERLNRRQHLGLAALKDAAGLRDAVVAFDLGYRLGPRINATGRIDNPYLGLDLLMTQDVSRAKLLAQELSQLNKERQELERETCDEAFRQLETTFRAGQDFAAIAVHDDWHPGVIGLVAGKMAQKFRVPGIALLRDKSSGEVRGSGRCPAIEGVSLMDILGQCSVHLSRYGGHAAAAGLSLKTESLEGFVSAFKATCKQALEGKNLNPALDIDAYVELGDVTLAFHDEIQKLEPCGQSNPSALWAARGVELAQAPIPLGEDRKHARLILRRKMPSGQVGGTMTAVMFGVEPDIFQHKAGNVIDIAFTTRVNTYNHDSELQLCVEDMRVCF